MGWQRFCAVWGMLWLGLGPVGIAEEEGAQVSDRPSAREFSRIVLHVLGTYPTDGQHRYYWPRGSKWAGNTRDLVYRGELFSAGDPQSRSYCCGLTFEVFFRSYESWCRRTRRPFVVAELDSKGLRNFRGRWFGSRTNLLCSQSAITEFGLGRRVELGEARPGDFVQFWRHSGSGHSVIFLAWKRDGNGQRKGLTYWSTQSSTNGIGRQTEWFGAPGGIDPERIHIARVGR